MSVGLGYIRFQNLICVPGFKLSQPLAATDHGEAEHAFANEGLRVTHKMICNVAPRIGDPTSWKAAFAIGDVSQRYFVVAYSVYFTRLPQQGCHVAGVSRCRQVGRRLSCSISFVEIDCGRVCH